MTELVRVFAEATRDFQAAPDDKARGDTALCIHDLSAIQFVCTVVSAVPGDTAEVGVWRGGGSKAIAATLRDRTHYACDTFTGLPNCDLTHDTEDANGAFALDVATKEEVFRELGRAPNLVICEGLFGEDGHPGVPDDARFALVHVDGDTYWTAKHALDFFWPRINDGGILLFHDYMWHGTPGVTTAVGAWLAANPDYTGYRIGTGHHMAIVKERGGKPVSDVPYETATFLDWVRGGAWQDAEELAEAEKRVCTFGPRVVLEIGSMNGASLLSWAASQPELIISVDISGNANRERVVSHLDTKLAIGCREFVGDSSDPETVAQVSAFLDDLGLPVDYLFIDGDHSYDGVKADYDLYTPLLSDRGMIGIHDIAHHDDSDVPRYWAEVSESQRSEEIIRNESGLGIGLIWR